MSGEPSPGPTKREVIRQDLDRERPPYVPWSFSLYSLWATAVGWMLAGMVLAFFVKE